MHKGQIFSTDLLFAMILIILGFGVVTMLIETSSYDSKHAALQNQLQEKTQLAMMLLTSSSVGQCDLNGTLIPHSINKSKINNSMNVSNLKKMLLLEDYNIQLNMSGEGILVLENVNNSNAVSIDLNVFVCKTGSTFLDLNKCLNSLCNTAPNNSNQVITLRVGK